MGGCFPKPFSPVNRIVLLARTVSTLKQGTSESFVSYGLRVIQAQPRLLAEDKRTAPGDLSPCKHAWQTLLMASLEAGQVQHVRLEHIREDPYPNAPSLTYPRQTTRNQRLTRNLHCLPDHACIGRHWHTPWTRPTVNHMDGQHRKGNLVQTNGGGKA